MKTEPITDTQLASAMQKLPTDRESLELWLQVNPRDPRLKLHAKTMANSALDCPDAELLLARALQFEQRLQSSLLEADVPLPRPALLEAHDRLPRSALLEAPTCDSAMLERFKRVAQAVPARHDDSPPAGPQSQVRSIVAKPRSRFRIGAGIAAVAAAVVITWSTLNPTNHHAFARDCAEHLEHEPFALAQTDIVPADLMQRALKKIGADFDLPGKVTYLMPCIIDGKQSVHTVMQSAHGPVTVYVFAGQMKLRSEQSHHGASTVRISPFEGGAFVLVADSSRAFDQLESKLLQAAQG